MANEKLFDWFREAVSNKAQTIDFILPRMALTFVDRRHPDALQASCHAQASRAMADLHARGMIKPEDKIVMFGSSKNSTLFHTIVTKNNGEILFDSLNSENGNVYHPDRKVYASRRWNGEANVTRELSFGDFLKNYVGYISVSGVKPKLELS